MKLDHLGIAVGSLDEALKLYRDGLGLEVASTETIEAEQVRVALVPLAGTRVELLEATGPESPIARFIGKRGPGLHHIALGVEDLDGTLERLKQKGVEVIPSRGETGAGGHRYAFLHPASCGGVLVELVESGRTEE